MPIRPAHARSTPGTGASLLLLVIGAALIALSAWRAERLPVLVQNAPRRDVGVAWLDRGEWVMPEARDTRTPARVVLLVHGLDEPGGIWDALAPALSDAGHRVARFDYPNDQPVPESADALADALRAMHASGVQETAIVAHSMGGLVSRDVLTRNDQERPIGVRVPLLITLGTPHAGSPWARWQPIAEAREQIQRWAESDTLDPMLLFGWNADGMGEAGEDLAVGSAFLTDLNARTHPPSTRVACIVAVIPSIPPDTPVGDLPAFARALGDGVVPADSAAFEHADSVHLVRANHRSMIRPVEIGEWLRSAFSSQPPPTPPAIPIVLDLLDPPGPGPEPSQTPP